MKNYSKKHIKHVFYKFGWNVGYEPFESMDYTHYRCDLGINYWEYMGRLAKSIVLSVRNNREEDEKNGL